MVFRPGPRVPGFVARSIYSSSWQAPLLTFGGSSSTAAMSTELILHYTVHHNWCDFFESSLQQQSHVGDGLLPIKRLIRCSAYKELPSSRRAAAAKSSRVAYSLFRMDAVSVVDEEDVIATVTASLDCFRYIDAKDALYLHLKEAGAQHLMPTTALLSHDVDSIEEVEESLRIFHELSCNRSGNEQLPDAPMLLKAALGSGGFGIYFVNTRSDVLAIFREHHRMALEAGPAFISGLMKESFDGLVPRWSLQRYVRSERVGEGSSSRIQIRAYAVVLRATSRCECLLYDRDFEARIPSYDEDLDEALSDLKGGSGGASSEDEEGADPVDAVEALERRCCSSTSARPYNRARNKAKTDRLLLCEMPEPVCSHAVREGVMRTCLETLRALEPRLRAYCSRNDPGSSGAEMSIAAFDLMLERTGDIFVVEANFCPAMPQQHKHMSDRYREHIIRLMASFVELGFAYSIQQGHLGGFAYGFSRAW